MTGGKEGARVLVSPQDRYVLAGLMDAAKEERADGQLRSKGWTSEEINHRLRCKGNA